MYNCMYMGGGIWTFLGVIFTLTSDLQASVGPSAWPVRHQGLATLENEIWPQLDLCLSVATSHQQTHWVLVLYSC